MSKEKPKEFYHESVVNFLRHARTNAQKCGMDPAEDRALLIRGSCGSIPTFVQALISELRNIPIGHRGS